jgi:hypothetical protein
LVSIFHPNGRRSRHKKSVIHSGNALRRISRVVTDKLVEEKLKRMPHPAYSPNLSPCDVFLSAYLKGKSIDRQGMTPEQLFPEVETTISEVPSGLISRVFGT